ncbi:serine/threonine protein kinase [Paenibacillus sp. GSMTC-2017]|uniref:serine/threonine protein kinase n=1 Tax=Paenibacillus sp. GSMTC-2017 TaxID=2794350 RepID=UPI0018D7EACD|nr:serine/threonine protein kinase [Paenibacillus sp. GSMTC-2017]MBH5317709.1 serine/threonine protein kinase [Paenibacillus sp. GSMTC-2017]
MAQEWKKAEIAIREILVEGNERNEEVTISGYADGLHCVGLGTDAAVFVYDLTPTYAFKIYTEQALHKKEMERSVYERLEGIPYFPEYYGEGRNYLVISYESGPTLLDCLLQGIEVPRTVIDDVEEARRLAYERGLNPRDIHLKNVISQSGRGKVLDVSEYVVEGDDKRWEHLVWAYDTIYPSIEGKAIPSWLLDSIKSGYRKLDQAGSNLDEYAQRISQLFSRFMK